MGLYSSNDDVKFVQSIYARQYGKDTVNPGTRMLALSTGILSLFIKRYVVQYNFEKSSEVLSYIGCCIYHFTLLPTVQAWFSRLPGDSEAPALVEWPNMLSFGMLASLAAVYWQQKHFPLNYKYNFYKVLVLHAVWQEFPTLKVALFWHHWDNWEFHSSSFKGQETEMLF